MKTAAIWISLIISFLFFSGSNLHKNINETAAYKNKDITWSTFRDNFPYNIQVIGVEEFKEDKSFNIIISEPPESFNIAEFKKLVNDNLGSYEIKTHNIGVDGWMKDIVISINDLDNPSQFVKRLSKLLYGTDYKSYYINLSSAVKPAPYLAQDQNLNISAVELQKWLVQNSELFYQGNDLRHTYRLRDMGAMAKTGVFTV